MYITKFKFKNLFYFILYMGGCCYQKSPLYSIISNFPNPDDVEKSQVQETVPETATIQKTPSKKIVVFGDNKVGKTCLLERIEKGSFQEKYFPTTCNY